jgi:hypothetical protein
MRQRLELTLEVDPDSVLDRSRLVTVVAELAARLAPKQWAALELLALEVVRQSAVDRETRRQVLNLRES